MNEINRTILKTIAVTLAAVLAQLLIGALLYRVTGQIWDSGPELGETLLPMSAGTLLMITVLIYPTTRSKLGGGRLFLALFLLIFGLNVFLTNIEGAIFLDLSTAQFWSGIAHGALRAAVLSLLMVVAFGRRPAPPLPAAAQTRLTAGQVAWRLPLAAFCYLVLYFAAGLMIMPHIQAFYDTQNLNLGPWFLPFQLLRGALYVLFAWYFLRSIQAPRWQVALATATMFPIIAGVADLLLPMSFMPDHVRYWHILEIGWSNFVYGLLVGFLFWRGARSAGRTMANATPDQPARSVENGLSSS